MPHQTVDPGLMWRRGAMLLRLALGGLFIWTGLAKLQQPYEFLGAVYNYELVGPQTGLWIARALPWLEVVIGVSLVGGAWCRGGAILAIALFSVFTVAQAMAAGEGLKIPCGCAVGNQPEYTSYWKVAESGLMLLAAGLVFVGSLTPDLIPGVSRPSQPTGGKPEELRG